MARLHSGFTVPTAGTPEGSYAEFSSAVQAAYDGMGLVTDENDRVVRVRAKPERREDDPRRPEYGGNRQPLSVGYGGRKDDLLGWHRVNRRTRADAEPDSLLCLRGHAGGGISRETEAMV